LTAGLIAAFVTKQIVPTFEKFQRTHGGRRSPRNGMTILINTLGPSKSLSGENLTKQFEKVMALREQHNITDKECMYYLKMSHATYYRKKNYYRNRFHGNV
jgi:hypothetical protein